MSFGCRMVAQVQAATLGGHDSVARSWGFGVQLGIYVASRISGAHLVPAVSVARAVHQDFLHLPGNGVPPVCAMGGLRDQVVGTAILLFLIVAITDARYADRARPRPGTRLAPYLTGYGTAFRDQHGNLSCWVPMTGALIEARCTPSCTASCLARCPRLRQPEPAAQRISPERRSARWQTSSARSTRGRPAAGS